MVQVNTPFLRWKDRFHRSPFVRDSKFRIFLLRPTFDKLRRVSKENDEGKNTPATEVEILKFIKQVITSTSTNQKSFISKGFLSEKEETEITATYIENPSNQGGIVVLFPDARKFAGELDQDHIPIIINYVDDTPSWVEEGQNPVSIALYDIPKISDENLEKTTSYFVEENDADLRESKVFPTDILLDETKDEEENIRLTLQTLRRLLAEIRVTDRGGEPSEEQAKAMNKFDLGTNPILNITGRPGTGKTTVAQIAAAEAALQPASGARKGNRKVMYLTTTGNLKSEAYEEIVAIISSVYGLGTSVQQKAMNCIDVITRDDLIAELPQQDRRLDPRIIENILNSLDSNELESVKKWWGPQNPDDLFRVIQNFVYGVFGSINKFIDWYDNAPRRSGFKPSDKKGWSKVFGSERKWNLVDPSDELLPTGRDQFPLFRVWNPYDSDDFDNLTQKQLNEGYEKIRDLKNLLSINDFKSELFDESLSGNWTYASVLDYLSSVADSNTTKFRTDIWSKFRNSYDVIIVDESQDFTIRELACVLRVFSHRAAKKITARSSFSFVCAGDPLQTIEGSIFNAKHSHINAVYEDWKQYLSDSNADRGLRDPDHTELKANYRNAEPIVTSALNPIIAKMNEYDRRTISQQRPAFNRPGLIHRGSRIDFEDSEEINVSKIAADRLHYQLSKSLSSKDDQSLKPNPTTALILPRQNFSTLEQLRDCLTKNGIWNYISDGSESGDTIGTIIEQLISEEENDGIRYRQTLNDSGIYDIEGIKGRTVRFAIALNFANKAVREVKEGNESRSLLSLSHLLVASSRPQFGLLLHDPEKKHDDLDSLNIKLEDKLKHEDIKRLFEDETVDYNPSEYFSRAMNSAFLDASRSDDMGSPDTLYWNIAVKAASQSSRGKEFVEFCKKIHEYYGRDAPVKIIELLDDQKDTEIDRLHQSANEIDQASCWVIDGKTTRDKLLTFMKWKVFVDHGQLPSKIGSETLHNWIEWAKLRDDVELTGRILGVTDDDSSRWNFSPFYFKDPPIDGSYKRQPTRARRDDCSFSCEVPHRWLFGDMVMESVYTTPYEHLRKRLVDLKPSNSRKEKPDLRNWFTVRWFLSSSQLDQEIHRRPRFKDDLVKIAKESIDEGMGQVLVEWMLESIKPSKSDDFDKSLFRELVHWCSGNDQQNFRSMFKQVVTEYLIQIIEENPDTWDNENNILGIARLFCSDFKEEREDFDKEDHLRQFWREVTDSDDFVECFDKWYHNKLTDVRSTHTNPSNLENLITRILNVRTIYSIHRFEVMSQGEDSNDTTEKLKQSKDKNVLERLTVMYDYISRYQMRNEDPREFSSTIANVGLWSEFQDDSEKALAIELLREWMSTTPGGAFGKLSKRRNQRSLDLIENILMPINPEESLSRINKKSTMYIRSLRNFGNIQLNYYFENLYINSIKNGKNSNFLNDPILQFLTALKLQKRKESGKQQAKRILRWKSINVLKALEKTEFEPPLETTLYRQSMNFWNTMQDRKMSPNLRRLVMDKLRSTDGCKYRELEHPPTLFNMTLYSHDSNDPILSRFARVPMPSINQNGVVNPFSNTNPGIIGYNLTVPKKGPYDDRDLELIRSAFRRSGCYREAAAMDIVLSILGYRESKEMISMALQERAGVFHDQVTINFRWANKDRLSKSAKIDEKYILQSPLTFMLSLEEIDGGISPLYPNPVGKLNYGLSGPGAHDSLNLLPQNLTDFEIAKLLSKQDKRNKVKPDKINLIDEIIDLKDVRVPNRDQQEVMARLSQIVVNLLHSTRTLLPYILLSNEIESGVEINDISWFELEHPSWPDVWDVPTEQLSREILIEEIKKQDEWLYLLYENYMKTGEIDTDTFIESLPTSNLKSIVEIYLGRTKVVEEIDEETVDIDQIEETADLDTKEEDPEPVILCENCSKDLTLLLSVTDLNFCPDCGNKLN